MNILSEEFYESKRCRKRMYLIDVKKYEDTYYDNNVNSIYERAYYITEEIIKVEQFYISGGMETLRWYLNENIHNDNEPAEILYYKSGKVKAKIWYKNHNRHRDNEPAEEYFSEDGKIISKRWYKNNEKHRVDEPAEEVFDHILNTINRAWYHNGVKTKHENYRDNNLITRIEYDGEFSTREYFNYTDERVIKHWFKNNKLFRNNDLHTIEEYKNNKIIKKSWKGENGRYFRINDLPTEEEYENDILICKSWKYDEYSYTRINDSPTIERYSNGKIVKKIWIHNDISRNNDLPATEEYDENENIICKQWYNEGVRHRENNFAVEYYKNGILTDGETWINGVRKINFVKLIDNIESCCICHDKCDTMIKTKCNHVYCSDCIQKWITEKKYTCPYCTQNL